MKVRATSVRALRGMGRADGFSSDDGIIVPVPLAIVYFLETRRQAKDIRHWLRRGHLQGWVYPHFVVKCGAPLPEQRRSWRPENGYRKKRKNEKLLQKSEPMG